MRNGCGVIKVEQNKSQNINTINFNLSEENNELNITSDKIKIKNTSEYSATENDSDDDYELNNLTSSENMIIYSNEKSEQKNVIEVNTTNSQIVSDTIEISQQNNIFSEIVNVEELIDRLGEEPIIVQTKSVNLSNKPSTYLDIISNSFDSPNELNSPNQLDSPNVALSKWSLRRICRAKGLAKRPFQPPFLEVCSPLDIPAKIKAHSPCRERAFEVH